MELRELRAELEKRRVLEEENELRDDEIRMLYEAVEQIPSIVVLINQEGIIEYVNPSFMDATGYTRDEALGQPLDILNPRNISPEDLRKIWEQLRDGQDWKGEFHNTRKNGDLYWEKALISSVLGLDGEIRHFLKVAEDITRKKVHKQELVNIIINTTHLINTPLTVALGQLDLVQGGYKKINDEIVKKIHSKVTEVSELVKTQLITNVGLLTKETSDGWTPVKKKNRDDPEDEFDFELEFDDEE